MSTTVNSASGASGSGQVWSGASVRKPMSQKMSDLFSQIDTSSSGSISKTQFEQALQNNSGPASFKKAGADTIWAKLDPNGTGSVNKQQFLDGMQQMRTELRGGHHHHSNTASSQTSAASTVSSSLEGLSSVGQNVNTVA